MLPISLKEEFEYWQRQEIGVIDKKIQLKAQSINERYSRISKGWLDLGNVELAGIKDLLMQTFEVIDGNFSENFKENRLHCVIDLLIT